MGSAAALSAPACAHATTVTMGNPNVPVTRDTSFGCGPSCSGSTYAQSFSLLTALDFAPAAGVIRSWRVTGEGALALRVIEGGPEGGWLGRGTSAAATNLNGQPNATNLPIGAGDLIGVDLLPSPTRDLVGEEELENGERLGWTPALADAGMEREPSVERGERFQLNAEVVLRPTVSSLSPASGSNTGGNAVKIGGLYLDGVTSVTFGSTPASSFSVDSSSQITAVAPASTAAGVDVRVSGPGGSSEVSSADRYTFTAPATSTNTTVTSGPALQPVKPTVTGFSESSSRWRRGRSLPHISSAGGAPVGTTFSFSLNEPASVNLTFTRSVPGRRVAGRCVAPGHRNAGRPRCKRTLLVGSFAVPGHVGVDKVRFQGLLSGTKTLKPGSYLVSVTAREAHGLKVVSRSLSFTIIS
jgi:IPT/TIG domain